MNCQCYVCQQLAAGFSQQYCSQCGLAILGSVPQPVNPILYAQEKQIASCTNLAIKELWDVKADVHAISDASISDRCSYRNTWPSVKNECPANNMSMRDGTMSVAASERDERRHPPIKSGSRVQPTYSAPAFKYVCDIENEERLRETEKANHLAALKIEADALQASRWKTRDFLSEEEGRKQVSQKILGDERKKEINLAIAKQNEMEIIEAVERRKLAEQETAAILQRQEMDALECTRRTLQLEAAKRRREDELADIQWRRRVAEQAADDATRRRQAIDDYLQLHRDPCYQPIVATRSENICGIASDISVCAKSTNMDAIVGSDDHRLSQDMISYSEGLCDYCQQMCEICTTFQSAGNILSVPSKLTCTPTPAYEKNIKKTSNFEETPKLISTAESNLMRELQSYGSMPKLASQPSVHPRIKSAAISRQDLAAAKNTDTLPDKKTMQEIKRPGHIDKDIKEAQSDKAFVAPPTKKKRLFGCQIQ